MSQARVGSLRVARLAVLAILSGVAIPAAATPRAMAADGSGEALAGRCEVGKAKLVTDKRALRNLIDLGFPEAWQKATGKGVRVAVVDNGVDTRNAHLRKGVTGGRSFVGGSATQVINAHGTAVASIIAARRIEGSVVVGAAYNATIIPVKTMVEGPADTSTRDTARGIRWAADKNADVINVSFAAGPSDKSLPALRDATQYAVRKGSLVVAAGGNADGRFTQVQFPAGVDGVIGVTATDAQGAVTDAMTHGPHIDVSAPGADIPVAFGGAGDCIIGQERPASSYATAYVSALAALLIERFPNDTPAQISNRILSTADRPVANKRDDSRGWGTIRPVAAINSTTSAKPGGNGTSVAAAQTTNLTPKLKTDDPMRPARRELSWWIVLAIGLAAVALVVAPFTRHLRANTR